MARALALVAVLIGCGSSSPTGPVTLTFQKPELLRTCNGDICPLPTGPAPARCPDGTYCRQRTLHIGSDPAGIDCGTADAATTCSATFERGTTMMLIVGFYDYSGYCPIHPCTLTPLGTPCEDPFVLDASMSLDLSFQCVAP